MNRLKAFSELKQARVSQIGGKACALFKLMRAGFNIPLSFCLPVDCYDEFVRQNHLSGRIQLELNRKDLADCRWEELWDTALRIKNSFIQGRLSESLRASLAEIFALIPPGTSLAVRSSSTVEDSLKQSFAGLHDSYLGICNLEQLEKKIILVWASLWSDAALSYRKELDLSVKSSKMAVVIQAMLVGSSSGIAFSQNPLDENQAVIEAVYGLNQGLVDGKVQPDRWFIDRADGRIIQHQRSERTEKLIDVGGDQVLAATTFGEQKRAPLSHDGVKKVFSLSCEAESFFQKPQDVEWTLKDGKLYLLQSRPVTTRSKPDPKENRRDWDLSLKRSFENLMQLQRQIKNLLKKMTAEADRLDLHQINDCSDAELCRFHGLCQEALQRWTDVYWDVFIPYAHGMRLFGQVYNETVVPDDPFEFVALLQKQANLATRRNDELLRLAQIIGENAADARAVSQGQYSRLGSKALEQLRRLVREFAMPRELLALDSGDSFTRDFFTFVTNGLPSGRGRVEILPNRLRELEKKFFDRFTDPAGKKRARQLLELGRHSFMMRDDDNAYLNRFKELHRASLDAMRRLLKPLVGAEITLYTEADLVSRMSDKNYRFTPKKTDKKELKAQSPRLPGQKRQLTGQPAGPGFARGVARQIVCSSDLFALKKGEIIVCDAIGPEMTFAVPLAGGIIERRGGMLIHGAIIAREYGIPCVTGIADAMLAIKTGDILSLDGHLGLVTIDRTPR